MVRSSLLRGLVACLPVAPLSLAASAADTAADAPVLYAYTEVEPPPTYDRIILEAVNNAGDAAGVLIRHWVPDYYIVIRYADGEFRVLRRPAECQKADYPHVVRIDDRGQLLVQMWGCGSPHGSQSALWGPESKWTWIDLPGFSGVQANGMNDFGEVVGTASGRHGRQVGFLWKKSGELQTFTADGGFDFTSINDKHEIAGNIKHLPDPKRAYDRSGTSAALFHQNQDPLPTGDASIQTLAQYKDPAHWSYHVNSTAAGINERGDIALTSPGGFGNARMLACRWHRGDGIQCARNTRNDTHAVGIDGAGNLIVVQDNKRPYSYVMQPDGSTYTLGAVSTPAAPGLSAWGISERGYVVGRIKGRLATSSFILAPLW